MDPRRAAMLLVTVLAGAAAAGPLPPALAEARARLERATAAERGVAARRRRAAAASAQAASHLGDDGGFERWEEVRGALLQELVARYEERARLDLGQDAAAARRRELRRQWDILKDHRQYVDDAFWRALDSELRQLTRDAEAHAAERDRKKQALDLDLAALQRRLAAHDAALAEATQLRLDEAALTAWTAALLEEAQAERDYQVAVDEVAAAFEGFLQSLGSQAPPYLKEVTLEADGARLYQGRWLGGAGDETAAERQRAEIRQALRGLRTRLAEIAAEREALRGPRLEIAMGLKPLSDRLEQAAARYGQALLSKVYAEVATEIAFTTLEVALTGGTATLARKGAELATQAAEAGTRAAYRRVAKVASGLDGPAFRKSLQASSDRAVKQTLDEVLEASAGWRRRYVQEAVEKARREATARGQDAAAAARRAQRQAEQLLAQADEAGKALERGRSLEATARKAIAEAERFLTEGSEAATKNKATMLVRKAAAGLAMRGGAGRPLEGRLPAWAEEGGKVLLSDGIETAVGTSLTSSLSGVARSLATVAGEGRWARLKAGASGAASGLRLGNLKEVLKSRGNVIGYVGTAVKAGAGAYFAQQAADADLVFWQLYAEHAVQYGLFLAALEPDRELWEAEREVRQAIAEGQAALLAGLEPRRLVVASETPLPESGRTLTVRLTFSSPLPVAPLVRLGGRSTPPVAQGAVPAASWRMELDATTLAGVGERAGLEVSLGAGNRPWTALDTEPATPAHLRDGFRRWEGYQEGVDRNHGLRLQPRRQAEDRELPGTRFTRVRMREIWAPETPAAAPERLELAPGRGMLRRLARDAAGKLFQCHTRVTGPGKTAEGTWKEWMELVPGSYRLSFDGFTPPLELEGVTVQAGGVRTVEVGGYGRLTQRAHDGLGQAFGTHLDVYRLGQKERLVGSWQASLDLPPGRYRVVFTAFTPPIEHPDLEIRRGHETVLEARGYGRLRRLARDGVGKVVGAHIDVRPAGAKDRLLGSWSETVDVPPGSYQVSFTGYTPPLVHQGVPVEAEREVQVEARGHGRIGLAARDGLGERSSSHVNVYPEGAKEALVGTWQPHVDVPPGAYRVVFTSYTPPIEFHNVVVGPHRETLLEARGYGRLEVDFRDRAGTRVSRHFRIRRPGSKDALLGSWAQHVDLPPGPWEVSYHLGDQERSASVQVQEHQGASVRLPGE